jgi:hypothetical protein
MRPCIPKQPDRPLPRVRRGAALFIVMMFVVVSAALALTAIVTTGNASLVAKSYARENDLKYAAEAALAIGKSRLNFDAEALPDTGFIVLMSNASLMSADNQPIPGVTVTVYAGPSGSSSGQFGRFASVVAEARDNQGNGFIRRLELTQESFAKYAYWSDKESNGGTTIYFGGGDQLWGPVYSNDVIHIASSGATFNDEVGTTKTISGKSSGTFRKGYKENQTPIKLPNTSDLSSKLSGFASAAGWNLAPPSSGSTVNPRMRIEFVAIDMNLDGDSTDANEGFFKVYTANTTGGASWARGDYTGSSSPSSSDIRLCGDYHYGKFYPAAVHSAGWFETLMDTLPGGMTASQAEAESEASASTIMNKAGTRCFLGGANQLAAVGRTAALGYSNAAMRKGGDDTTFTPTDQYGAWKLNSDSIADSVKTLLQLRRPQDWRYLYPLHRTMNKNAKGVIYVPGSVGVSGTVRGRVTIYATGTIVVLDDIRYASDPVGGVCNDILGLLAGADVVVADNAVLTPQRVKWSSSSVYKNLDDSKDLYLHAVVMALNTSFPVENFDGGPSNVNDCESSDNGRGCLYLSGGLIQAERGAVGLLGGEGYTKRYSYDRCAVVTPPPYFPTTGRFTDNRYYELNPVGFNAGQLYRSLTPNQ